LPKDWAYLFGAACPARGVGAAAMNLNLAEISSQFAPGARALITRDDAGWHQTGGRLNLPDTSSPLLQPPYSPECNPVENIWQFLRQSHLAKRGLETYDDIVNAGCIARNALIAAPATITSTATHNGRRVRA